MHVGSHWATNLLNHTICGLDSAPGNTQLEPSGFALLIVALCTIIPLVVWFNKHKYIKGK